MLGFFVITQVYGTPNPATPGGYGGPYTPNTPGGGMYGSEPSYSPYTQSPSPAGFGNPMTPGSIAPVSPAYNPLTPGAGMEETQADWVTTDIEVRINENHEVGSLKLSCSVVKLRCGDIPACNVRRHLGYRFIHDSGIPLYRHQWAIKIWSHYQFFDRLFQMQI